MSRYKRFTFLCNPNERRMIAFLARQLQRSQSDAIRYIIRKAVKVHEYDDKLLNDRKNEELNND